MNKILIRIILKKRKKIKFRENKNYILIMMKKKVTLLLNRKKNNLRKVMKMKIKIDKVIPNNKKIVTIQS